MTLSDEELRYLTIDILKEDTERDLQTQIGVSNLANGCDYCLACAFAGISRETNLTDRAWGGRVLGTAIHTVMQQRLDKRIQDDKDNFAKRFPGALVEFHGTLGVIPGYGPVGSTSDFVLPSHRCAIDWKGSTMAKLAILQDYMAIQRGEEPPYGRKHTVHKAKTLSETAYAEAMAEMAYKVTGYYMQLQGYGLMLNNMNIPTSRLSIVWIARDDTMWFDNPTEDRYDDPKAKHGVVITSFDYSQAYAETVWDRGVQIWEGLESGKTVSDFARHPLCFPCGLDGGGQVAIDLMAPIPMNETRVEEPSGEWVDAKFAEIIATI